MMSAQREKETMLKTVRVKAGWGSAPCLKVEVGEPVTAFPYNKLKEQARKAWAQ